MPKYIIVRLCGRGISMGPGCLIDLDESYIKTNKIAPRDVLSDNYICNDNHLDANTSYNEIIVATGKKENTKNICRDINESESYTEKKIAQKSSKLKYVLSNSVNKNTIASTAKGSIGRKRGRPKKEKDLMKPRKNPDEQETYKAKIKEYDAEIAKYMSLYCDICNSKYENFPALRVHMRDTHNIKEGYVTCCEKKFNKRALLLYHIRQHLNPSCYRLVSLHIENLMTFDINTNLEIRLFIFFFFVLNISKRIKHFFTT